ncbi:MAG: DUF2027 domain-containing protein, partial [Paramuribaculum sp.]|nr:DUF2027 domain-containing protein [Paramuribaculum sp.]
FLNSTGGGEVTKIEGNIAYVTDEDGFDTPVLVRECVVVDNSTAWERAKARVEQPAVSSKPAPQPQIKDTTPDETEIELEEVEGGDVMNLVLGFEADNLKTLSDTTYFAYLVNDSNYYLYFTYMSAGDNGDWTTRYAGIVEPGIQVLLEEFNKEDVVDLEKIAVQAIAFKKCKEFELQQPVSLIIKPDVTKFFKLHCFKSNPYFDVPVLAFDIVKNGVVPAREPLDVEKLVESVKQPKQEDRKKKWKRPVVKNSEYIPGGNGIIEVDLHIDEIVDTTAGLTNADMLNLQVDEFRKVMDANKLNKGQKIVFIHGKGDGVLRQALMKELNYRYKGMVEVQDASFREYGFGATQVTVR